jgi:polyhydroxyalkanoate synthesis regulator phasin
MKLQNQWKRLLIGGAAALTLTAGVLWTVNNASAASTSGNWATGVTQQVMEFAGRGGHGPGRGGAFLGGDQEQYLADALGITVEELQAAQETVRNNLIDQAVANGDITQEQADQLKAGERVRVPGLKMYGMKGDDAVAHEALLADALGITVDELDAAKSAARDAALADALANGDLTQEQVDLMAAHQAFRDYLREQYADERPTATMEALIGEAVDAGAITQEQADLLLSAPAQMGPRGRGGDFAAPDGERRSPGRGGRGGHGVENGQPDDAQPDSTQPNENGSENGSESEDTTEDSGA